MRRHSIAAVLLWFTLMPAGAAAQQLSLERAVERARAAHPAVLAAREAANAAAAHEQQARAWLNPNISYSREQAGGNELRSTQDIISLDQRLELGGQRAARVEAARLRRMAAESRLAAVQADIELEVARAYANARATDRMVELATQAAAAFAAARRSADERLAAGDISGYDARRLKLEAARYSAAALEARQEQHTARLALASISGVPADSAERLQLAEFTFSGPPFARDSIDVWLRRQTYELAAARFDADALAAAARLAQRERTPNPTVLAGFKRESAGGASLNGFVAGIAIPLPIFDRRTGAIAAAEAEARSKAAEADALQRTLSLNAQRAAEAADRLDQQVAALRAELGDESRLALSAAEAAYAEGEITLVAWLDAVRAYQEAETSLARLSSQAMIQRATLLRTLGLPITSR